jgi:hypothetical protein
VFGIFELSKEILELAKEILKGQQKMSPTIDQLAADFATFQSAFTTFVTNVQTSLANILAGGVTPAQQAELDSIDSGFTSMEATIAGITFPSTTGSSPTSPTPQAQKFVPPTSTK